MDRDRVKFATFYAVGAYYADCHLLCKQLPIAAAVSISVYPPIYRGYETARRLDAATAAHHRARRLGKNLDPDEACGWLAVAGLLIESSRRGLTAERLALCNSGDERHMPQRRRLWRLDVHLAYAGGRSAFCAFQGSGDA